MIKVSQQTATRLENENLFKYVHTCKSIIPFLSCFLEKIAFTNKRILLKPSGFHIMATIIPYSSIKHILVFNGYCIQWDSFSFKKKRAVLGRNDQNISSETNNVTCLFVAGWPWLETRHLPKPFTSLCSWIGKRKYNKGFIIWGKVGERSFTKYCHRQNRLELGILIELINNKFGPG